MFSNAWNAIKEIFTGPDLKTQYEQMLVESAAQEVKEQTPGITITTTEIIDDVKVSDTGEVTIITADVIEDVVVPVVVDLKTESIVATPLIELPVESIPLGTVNTQITDAVTVAPTPPKRAKTAKGKFVADDKSTPDVNEAWVGGKAPTKKAAKTKSVGKRKKK